MFIFSFLFKGENGKRSYETCLSIIQEEKNGKSKIDIDFQFLFFSPVHSLRGREGNQVSARPGEEYDVML